MWAHHLGFTVCRSHAIITLYVESKVPFVTPPPSEEEGVEEDHSNIAGHLLMGKLHLVDLAGGERVDVSKPQGEDLAKAQYINKSLLAFGEVLHTLAASAVMNKKKSKLSLVSVSTDTIPPVSTPVKTSSDLHVPYLDNRLTHFLKDSLGGYARTVLLTCIGPEGENYYVNLHCLQYASKALKVANLVAPIRIDIPASIELDPTSELSIIK